MLSIVGDLPILRLSPEMPRDDTDPSTTAAEALNGSDKAPLKRGDACLYCRKRRIRCSATKPSCDHCTKLKRPCVYDTGKPVSRVKQLEDKVAELEDMLRAGPAVANVLANDAAGAPTSVRQHGSASTDFAVPSNDSVDISMLDSLPPTNGDATDAFMNFGASMFGSYHPKPTPNGFPPAMVPNIPDSNAVNFDFSTLDPNFMSLLNSFQTSTGLAPAPSQPVPTSGPAQRSTETPGQNYSFLQASVPAPGPITFTSVDPLSQGTTSNDTRAAQAPPSFASPPGPPTPNTAAMFQAFVQDLSETPSTHAQPQSRSSLSSTIDQLTSGAHSPMDHSIDAVNGDSRTNIALGLKTQLGNPHPPPAVPGPTLQPNLPNAGDMGSFGWLKTVEAEPEGLPLVGGWFDAADLPKVARDHL